MFNFPTLLNILLAYLWMQIVAGTCPAGWTQKIDACFKDYTVNGALINHQASLNLCVGLGLNASLPVFRDQFDFMEFNEFVEDNGLTGNHVFVSGAYDTLSSEIRVTEYDLKTCAIRFEMWASDAPNNPPRKKLIRRKSIKQQGIGDVFPSSTVYTVCQIPSYQTCTLEPLIDEFPSKSCADATFTKTKSACYKHLSGAVINRADARSECQALGGGSDLPRFRHKHDWSDFLGYVIVNNIKTDVHISGTDAAVEHTWVHDTGGYKLWYNTWGTGSLSGGTGKNFLVMAGTTNDMVDVDGAAVAETVCQIPLFPLVEEEGCPPGYTDFPGGCYIATDPPLVLTSYAEHEARCHNLEQGAYFAEFRHVFDWIDFNIWCADFGYLSNATFLSGNLMLPDMTEYLLKTSYGLRCEYPWLGWQNQYPRYDQPYAVSKFSGLYWNFVATDVYNFNNKANICQIPKFDVCSYIPEPAPASEFPSSTCPIGWKTGEKACYKKFKTPLLTHDAAEAKCVSKGAHLSVFRDEKDWLDFMKTSLSYNALHYTLHLAGKDCVTEGSWAVNFIGCHLSFVPYFHWGSNPPVIDTAKNCAVRRGTTYDMSDYNCSQTAMTVCQIPMWSLCSKIAECIFILNYFVRT